MVHAFVTLGFTVVALAAASLIWAMLSANRAAIAAALGMRPIVATPRVAGRRVRVRSVQPVMVRTVQLRRAA